MQIKSNTNGYTMLSHTVSLAASKQLYSIILLAVQPAGCEWGLLAASVCHTMLLWLIWGSKLLLLDLRDLAITSCSWSSNAQFLPATAATSRADAELSKGLL
jgi:hypothetical protein